MNTKNMTVHHRIQVTGQPYFQITDLPWFLDGTGAELTPDRARAYAKALLQAADDCEAFGPTRKNRYGVHMQRDVPQTYVLQREVAA